MALIYIKAIKPLLDDQNSLSLDGHLAKLIVSLKSEYRVNRHKGLRALKEKRLSEEKT